MICSSMKIECIEFLVRTCDKLSIFTVFPLHAQSVNAHAHSLCLLDGHLFTKMKSHCDTFGAGFIPSISTIDRHLIFSAWVS